MSQNALIFIIEMKEIFFSVIFEPVILLPEKWRQKIILKMLQLSDKLWDWCTCFWWIGEDFAPPPLYPRRIFHWLNQNYTFLTSTFIPRREMRSISSRGPIVFTYVLIFGLGKVLWKKKSLRTQKWDPNKI